MGRRERRARERTPAQDVARTRNGQHIATVTRAARRTPPTPAAAAQPTLPVLHQPSKIDRRARRALSRARASQFKANAELELRVEAAASADAQAFHRTVIVMETPLAPGVSLEDGRALYLIDDWMAGLPGALIYKGELTLRWPDLPRGPDGRFPGTAILRELGADGAVPLATQTVSPPFASF